MRYTFPIALGCAMLIAGNVIGQDYSSMTLNFENITSTNIDQNVGELSSNEKFIDMGDYDADGDIDVVIANGSGAFGQRRNKLYRNDNGVLNEVSGAPVIPGFSPTDVSRVALFADYDHDGFLDIIVVNDSNAGTNSNDAPGKTKFFRYSNGIFVNESERLDNQTGAACSGSIGDFDNNGYVDLYMCNYPFSSQDSIGFNNIGGTGAGNFTDLTNTHAATESDYGVHSAVGDMNGDGKLDVLVGNLGDPDFIFYNDNNGAGSDVGDFRYGGSGAETLFNPSGASGYQSLVPADFNGDGMMDFYYSNSSSNRGDNIYINTGNDSSNRATFQIQAMPAAMQGETNKISTPDLDGDGRPDLVVMSEARRPYIYRNTSENGEVSFVEWTPAVITSTHDGWHAEAGDVTGNSRADLFIGADSNDFLFENVDADITQYDNLSGGTLPGFHNGDAVAITGSIAGGSSATMTGSGLPSGARVSILLRGADDLNLNVTGSNTTSSNRPGQHVDEAVQFTKSGSGDFTVTVTNQSPTLYYGDANLDGNVNLLDVNVFVDALANGTDSLIIDMNLDGVVNLLDVSLFVDAISNGSKQEFETEFVIEFLSRSN